MTDTTTTPRTFAPIIFEGRTEPMVGEPTALDLSTWTLPQTSEEIRHGFDAASYDGDESPEDFITPIPKAVQSAEVAVPAAVPVAAPEVPAVAVAVTEPEAAVAAPAEKFTTFTLIDPNRRWVMVTAIILLGGILAASLVSSFASVYASAAWIGMPTQLQWLPVVILDVAIVGYSWSLMVLSSRIAQPRTALENETLRPEKLGRTRLILMIVTLYSTAANFLHTFSFWNGDVANPEAIFGLTFSASIPLLALFATEELIRLAFIRRKRIHQHTN